jgi:hypothetical protein
LYLRSSCSAGESQRFSNETYLLLDHHLVNAHTRDDEVGIGLSDMIPGHLDGIDLIVGSEIDFVMRSRM